MRNLRHTAADATESWHVTSGHCVLNSSAAAWSGTQKKHDVAGLAISKTDNDIMGSSWCEAPSAAVRRSAEVVFLRRLLVLPTFLWRGSRRKVLAKPRKHS